MTQFYDNPAAMAPMAPVVDGALQALAQRVNNAAHQLTGRLHPLTAQAVAAFLRPMNCYYSNLIEGHNTSPLDIERAMKRDYSADRRQRNLQQEAAAHMLTQEAVGTRLAGADATINPYEPTVWQWLHEEFYRHLPADFREVTGKDGEVLAVVPGQLRTTPVIVGRHVAPLASALPAFAAHFAWYYKPNRTFDPLERIVNIAAAHHRFAWIHPFLDGNGRIGRLLSEVALRVEGLAADGLWAVARGLARRREEYLTLLANADQQRYNDHDGKGNLSEKALRAFTVFFLEVALDQLHYMTQALNTDALLDRLLTLAELLIIRNKLPRTVGYVLQELFLRGQLLRRDFPRLLGKSENPARSIANQLGQLGLLTEGSNRRYYQVAYPVDFSPVLFPGLYPLGPEMDMMNALRHPAAT